VQCVFEKEKKGTGENNLCLCESGCDFCDFVDFLAAEINKYFTKIKRRFHNITSKAALRCGSKV
jgi:hypothetical protein